MGSRLDLQAILEAIVGSDNVYFQPPTGKEMSYPCIVYKRNDTKTAHADNIPYRQTLRYMVTVMDRNPDSDIPGKVAALPLCSHDRSYAASKLNHDVYILYF
jgi:hypothetical protein